MTLLQGSDQKHQTIGFIGVGNMGAPMVARLAAAGYSVRIYDQNASVVARIAREHPGVTSVDPAELARADVLITMLPNSDIVEAVLFEGGEQSLVRQARPGTIFIDMSSSEPQRSALLGSKLSELGHAYLDAPVSGGVRGAIAGRLAIMVGGPDLLLERMRSLFEALGDRIVHVGAHGSGHAAKALNNLVSATTVTVTVEAVRTAEQFGIAPETFVRVLNSSSGRSNTSEAKVSQFMLSGSYDSGFPIGLMAKDVGIAQRLAAGLGGATGIGASVAQIWDGLVSAGHGAEDHTKTYELLTNHPRTEGIATCPQQ